MKRDRLIVWQSTITQPDGTIVPVWRWRRRSRNNILCEGQAHGGPGGKSNAKRAALRSNPDLNRDDITTLPAWFDPEVSG
jgi:hypothetical protein